MDLLLLSTNGLIALANAMVIALMMIIFVERHFAIGDGIAHIGLVRICHRDSLMDDKKVRKDPAKRI